MTTTDIVGLCERLRAITTTDHERLCQGREYTCSCGWDEENAASATQAADTIERQAAEIERLRRGAGKSNDEVCQVLGKALGYPWFKNDQLNFPDATEEDGVCVGDHVAESIADEAADTIERQATKIKQLEKAIIAIGNNEK